MRPPHPTSLISSLGPLAVAGGLTQCRRMSTCSGIAPVSLKPFAYLSPLPSNFQPWVANPGPPQHTQFWSVSSQVSSTLPLYSKSQERHLSPPAPSAPPQTTGKKARENGWTHMAVITNKTREHPGAQSAPPREGLGPETAQLGHFHWQQVGEQLGSWAHCQGAPSLPFQLSRNPQKLQTPQRDRSQADRTAKSEPGQALSRGSPAGARSCGWDLDSAAKQR